jgi:hypothetical protein
VVTLGQEFQTYREPALQSALKQNFGKMQVTLPDLTSTKK